jgi:hypothetical protein
VILELFGCQAVRLYWETRLAADLLVKLEEDRALVTKLKSEVEKLRSEVEKLRKDLADPPVEWLLPAHYDSRFSQWTCQVTPNTVHRKLVWGDWRGFVSKAGAEDLERQIQQSWNQCVDASGLKDNTIIKLDLQP